MKKNKGRAVLIYASEIQIPRPSHIGTGQWQLKGLNEITVLFGRNGSGKSLLLRAWRDSNPQDVHYIAPERTGDMDFQPQYLQEEFEPQRRRNASQRNWVPDYRRRIVGRIQTYFLTRGDVRGDQPAPGNPDEIEEFLSSLVPDFVIELMASQIPPYVLKRAKDGRVIQKVDELSSGEAQMLSMGLDILTIAALWELHEQEVRVLLLDEPDAHIHPDLEARFAEFLLRVADRFQIQVVIATHSTSLLASLGQFGGGKSSVIYLNRKDEEFRARRFNAVLKDIAALLGGNLLMGPLFGAPLLLVEGDDDYRIWSQVPRHHIINLAVIPAQGEEIKRYQRMLEEIFRSMQRRSKQPVGYALIDADKPLPIANPQNTQDYIRFIRLSCLEAENLYLTDEVLGALGIDWNAAALKITEQSVHFGQKAEFLATALTWNPKTVDIKDCINEVAAILDAKPVHWTVRVGTAIGKQRPTGQLADFLGEQVLCALWGPEPT